MMSLKMILMVDMIGINIAIIHLSLDPVLLPDAHPGQVLVCQSHLEARVNHEVLHGDDGDDDDYDDYEGDDGD